MSTEHKQKLVINAEGEWEVASKPAWCEVSPASGTKKTEAVSYTHLISGVPLIVRLIESVAHIIATVAVYLEGSRLVSLVIYDINAHHVAVAETVVVDAGYGK